MAIDELVPDPNNPRSHPSANLKGIERSMERFQQVEPVIVQAGTNRIVAGHGRVITAREMGATHIWAIPIECSDIEATALGIALNRTAEKAEWDETKLADILKTAVADIDLDQELIDATGFSTAEIENIIKSVTSAASMTAHGTLDPDAIAFEQQQLEELNKRRAEVRAELEKRAAEGDVQAQEIISMNEDTDGAVDETAEALTPKTWRIIVRMEEGKLIVVPYAGETFEEQFTAKTLPGVLSALGKRIAKESADAAD